MRRDFTTTSSRDVKEVKAIKLQAYRLIQRANVPNAVIRDLLASDINSSYTDGTAAFTVTATGAGPVTVTSFNVPQGKAFVFYGYLDLNAGTKYIDSIQFNINSNAVPLHPIPLVYAQLGPELGPEPAVYFSPVGPLIQNQMVTITVHFTGAGTETFSIKGFVAESGTSGK